MGELSVRQRVFAASRNRDDVIHGRFFVAIPANTPVNGAEAKCADPTVSSHDVAHREAANGLSAATTSLTPERSRTSELPVVLQAALGGAVQLLAIGDCELDVTESTGPHLADGTPGSRTAPADLIAELDPYIRRLDR
ncbi:hypothetical protein [Kineosporia corallincola]|uniref:hypothetical protein n=1 Tax=Kineosporia corallincola TaxID=2835133 RepID=UPI001FE79D71|nr:hypothetical protein [Kineosporia corallincola]